MGSGLNSGGQAVCALRMEEWEPPGKWASTVEARHKAGRVLRWLQQGAWYSDVPPVHVATDHETGRAVPEVDAREVAQCIAQLREAAFCFQAVHQDLRRKKKMRCAVTILQTSIKHVSLHRRPGLGHYLRSH